MEEKRARKIELPEYACPYGARSYGGEAKCDHDYPPESKKERDDWVSWTCARCGMVREYEIYQ